IGILKRVSFSTKSDIGNKIFHHRLRSFHHQREHLLQFSASKRRSYFAPQVLPGRIFQPKQIPHSNAVFLLGPSEMSVGKIIKVTDQNLLDYLRVPQQKTWLVKNVETDIRRVLKRLAVNFSQVESWSGAEQNSIFEITKNYVCSLQLLHTASFPVAYSVKTVEINNKYKCYW
ncbi:Protein of unknown function, partial [Cotesia congregata]